MPTKSAKTPDHLQVSKPNLLDLPQDLSEPQASAQASGNNRPGAAADTLLTAGLQQTSGLFSAVFNGMAACVAILDPNFNFIRVNTAYAATDGRTPDEFAGRNHFDLYPNPENEAIFRQVLRTGRPYSVTNRPFEYQDHPERGISYWDWSLQPITGETGAIECLVLILTDVTERIQVELNLLEQAETIRLLQDIAVASNEARTVEDAYLRVIDRICLYTGWEVGHGLLRNPGGKLVGTGVWHLPEGEAFAQFAAETNRLEWAPVDGIIGQVMQTGQAACYIDVNDLPAFLRSETARQAGLHACFVLPVLSGREVVGVLEFYSQNTIIPSQSLLDSLPLIGSQLGRVIERQQAEQYLQDQQVLLNEVLNRLPVGVWIADEHGNIVHGNPAGQQIWAGARYVGVEQFGEYKGWWLASGERIEAHEWALARAIERGETALNELIEIECFDGTHKIIVNSAVPLNNNLGRRIGAIVVIQDITERQKMEGELAEVQRRLLSSLEAERTRLAQELHDGPMQDLYGLRLQLQLIEDDLYGRAGQSSIAEIRERLQSVVYTLRAICTDLRPPALAPFGLEVAIRSYVERFAEKHPTLTLHLDLQPDGQTLANPTRLALYRNCQQLLSNVVRHAQAANVWIRLQISPDQLSLEVQDDGQGFDASRPRIDLARQGNLGLIGASERAEALGGRLEIESQPGSGTLVRTVIPLA